MAVPPKRSTLRARIRDSRIGRAASADPRTAIELGLLAVTTFATIGSLVVSAGGIYLAWSALSASQEANDTARQARDVSAEANKLTSASLVASTLPFISIEYDAEALSFSIANKGNGPAIPYKITMSLDQGEPQGDSFGWTLLDRSYSMRPPRLEDVTDRLVSFGTPTLEAAFRRGLVTGTMPVVPMASEERVVLIHVDEGEAAEQLSGGLSANGSPVQPSEIVQRLRKEMAYLAERISMKYCYTNLQATIANGTSVGGLRHEVHDGLCGPVSADLVSGAAITFNPSAP